MSHHIEMVKTLRASGHRLTPQRESVLAVICDSEAHLSADEILKRVRTRYPYLNKSAVYRSLELLTQLGLVTQTDLGQGRAQYEVHHHPHHHHLICRKCGTVIQVDQESFEPLGKRLKHKYGFDAELDHFAVFGTCRACMESKGRDSTGSS
jgi:Fur family transcriptional regulator, ferric uptake regulator